MEKFKYLRVILLSDGRQDNELDTGIGEVSAVIRQLYRTVVLKRELCTKAKLFVLRSVFVLILIYGNECWVMTERLRSRVQAAEMGFLRKVRSLSLLDKVKSTDTLAIEPLLLRIERSKLRWYGHVTRMSHERTAKQLMDALPRGKRPRERSRTRWRNYVEDLAWSRFRIPSAKLLLVAGD